MLNYKFNFHRLTGARHEANITQGEMAKKLHMSRKSYGYKENGKWPLGANDLAIFANVTHKNIEYFFDITVTNSKQNVE